MSIDKHIPDYLREWFWSGNTLLYRIPVKRASDIILDCPDPIFAPTAEQKELIASAPFLKEENEKLRFQLEAIEGLTNERDSALEENEKLKARILLVQRERESIRESLKGGMNQLNDLLNNKITECANKADEISILGSRLFLKESENKRLREAQSDLQCSVDKLTEALKKIMESDASDSFSKDLFNIASAALNPTEDEKPEFYYEWGNEPFGEVSVGRYSDAEEFVSMGTMKKAEALKLQLPFLNPNA